MAAGFIELAPPELRWPIAQNAASQGVELISAYRWRAVAVSGVTGVIALALLLKVLRPASRPSDLHMLVADEQGFVVVDSQGIMTVAGQAAASSYGVVNSKVEIRGNGPSPIRLRAEVGVFPGADLKRAGSEARQNIRTAVERLVGLPVRDVVVAVRVVHPNELAEMMS